MTEREASDLNFGWNDETVRRPNCPQPTLRVNEWGKVEQPGYVWHSSTRRDESMEEREKAEQI